ncbi:MAG: ROK family protein, partial [Actinomycetota bacterium]|nr:ROK family protein [Actinomycetota bacterium]
MEFLGIDVGGTKIAAGIVDGDGRVVRRERVPTPQAGSDVVFDALAACVETVLAGAIPAGVGVACAGPIDIAAGTVSPLNIAGWRGFPLRERVSRLFPDVPVELANDGLCMALGEHWRGAGAGSRAMLGIVVSTGVGGGLVLDGRGHPGRSGNAGHFGHMVVEDDGPACVCGGRGCVEAIASGPNLARWARTQGWRTTENADAAVLAADARAGDAIAKAAFSRGGRAVGVAIAGATALIDLDVAVVGGGVAQAGELLFAPIRAAVTEHVG